MDLIFAGRPFPRPRWRPINQPTYPVGCGECLPQGSKCVPLQVPAPASASLRVQDSDPRHLPVSAVMSVPASPSSACPDAVPGVAQTTLFQPLGICLTLLPGKQHHLLGFSVSPSALTSQVTSSWQPLPLGDTGVLASAPHCSRGLDPALRSNRSRVVEGQGRGS